MAPPYGFAKGLIAAKLEDHLRVPARAKRILEDFRAVEAGTLAFEDTGFVRLFPATSDARRHLVHDTVGVGDPTAFDNMPPADQVIAQKAADLRKSVFIRGLIEAIETAYGIGPGADPGDLPLRPMVILWGCGRSEPQVWIDCRTQADNPILGQITVVFLSEVPETIVPPTFTSAAAAKQGVRDSGGLLVVRSARGAPPTVFLPPND